MKHIRLISVLLPVLLFSMAFMTACDKGAPSDTVVSDSVAADTETPTEMPTEAPTEAATDITTEKVNVTFWIKDQDGNSVTEATVTVLPVSGEGESATLTADAEGSMSVSLPAGQYTVRFDVLPEYILGMDIPITLTHGMEPVVLEVTDNTPNGSEARPFVISEDSISIPVPAGATYHFTLFGGYKRTLTVQDAGVEITYKDELYTPDPSGEIAIRIVTDSPSDHAFFALTNKSGETREIVVTILSDPGAMDNPISINALGESITANVPQDGMIYYKWTATASGTLTVSSTDAINNISLNNLTTSQVSDFTAGGESVSLTVTEGDDITVVVSVIGGDKQAEYQSVTFMLSMLPE